MNSNVITNFKIPDDIGWACYWIIFSSVAFIFYAFIPQAVSIQADLSNQIQAHESVSWFWDKFDFKLETIYQQASIYLALIGGLLLLVITKFLNGKMSMALVFSIVLILGSLFTLVILPQIEILKSLQRQLGLLLFVVSFSMVLIGAHLQKALNQYLFPRVILFSGGLLLLSWLLLPFQWPFGNTSVLNLFNGNVWQGSAIALSIFLTLVSLLASFSILSLFMSTQKVMSLLSRLVVISTPVVFYFYFADVKQVSILSALLETARYSFLLIALLIFPVSISSLIEMNTPSEREDLTK